MASLQFSKSYGMVTTTGVLMHARGQEDSSHVTIASLDSIIHEQMVVRLCSDSGRLPNKGSASGEKKKKKLCAESAPEMISAIGMC